MGKSTADIKQLLLNESFQAWISGTATPEVVQYWEAWMAKSVQRKKLVEEARAVWALTAFKPAAIPDVDAEYQEFQARLRSSLPAQRESTAESSGSGVGVPSTSSRRTWISYLVAACIVFLAITAGFLYYYSSEGARQSRVTIFAGYGERKTVRLPDRSVIILNANSSLSYDKSWSKSQKRSVRLKGEAYFRITHQADANKEYFSVITEDGAVRVLGTEFSVYQRAASGTRVTLKRGKIEVIVSSTKGTARTHLNPGEMVFFRKGDRSLHPETEKSTLYLDWWKNSFSLHYTPLSQVVQRIEDTYGVQIVIADSGLLERTLTGTIENQNLPTLLNALSKTMQIPLIQQGSRIILGNPAPMQRIN